MKTKISESCFTIEFSDTWSVDLWCEWFLHVASIFGYAHKQAYFNFTFLRLSHFHNLQMKSSETDISVLGLHARVRWDKQF